MDIEDFCDNSVFGEDENNQFQLNNSNQISQFDLQQTQCQDQQDLKQKDQIQNNILKKDRNQDQKEFEFIKNNYLQTISHDLTYKFCQKMKSVFNEIDILFELNNLPDINERKFFVQNYYINFDYTQQSNQPDLEQIQKQINKQNQNKNNLKNNLIQNSLNSNTSSNSQGNVTKKFELKVFLIQEQLSFTLQQYITQLYPKNGSNNQQILQYKINTYYLLHQLANALEILQKNHISHIDLKPPNIMVDQNNCLKIIDFGSARKINDAENKFFKGICITYGYSAPELLQNKPEINLNNDIWSFGMIMLSMLTGLSYYNSKDEFYQNQIFTLYDKNGKMQEKNLFETLKQIFIQANPIYQYNFSMLTENEIKIIKASLQWDHKKRVNAKQLGIAVLNLTQNLHTQLQNMQQEQFLQIEKFIYFIMQKKTLNLNASIQARKIQPIIESTEEFKKKIQNFELQNIYQNGSLINQINKKEKMEIEESNSQDDNNAFINERDITICCRVRPLLEQEQQQNFFNIISCSNPNIYLHNVKLNILQKPDINTQKFSLDHIFPEQTTTSQIFQQLNGKSLIDSAIEGGISTLFAYGQTGSGKTYTVQGLTEIVALQLFIQVQNFKNSQVPKFYNQKGDFQQFTIYLSFLQIIGNKVSDLLNPESNWKADILEDAFGQVQVRNVQEFEISSPEQFLEIQKNALKNRKSQETYKNESSSRTHSICQIKIKNNFLKSSEPGIFYLIDLVGSENASDSQFHDKQLIQQTKDINKSLMILKDCLLNRVKASQVIDKHIHIPYKASKLTNLLKDTFEIDSLRNTKTVVIACISPSVIDAQQSLNTLKYAGPIKVNYKNAQKLYKNPENPAYWNNKKTREWLQKNSKKIINFDDFLPFETGAQTLRLSTEEFSNRLQKQGYPKSQGVQLNYLLWEYFVNVRYQDKLKIQQRNQNKCIQQKNDTNNMEVNENNTQDLLKNQKQGQKLKQDLYAQKQQVQSDKQNISFMEKLLKHQKI
ncbi:Protein kinase-like domain [Pseudocohnilembus persalinus]|uniref:Protein kinase-like domain n=1 Tax=Pseudocohnilembus persalinus TaxID=266149 RepID=A0A0V0QW55_PSEPJ|nr:Protein kinase-like domain [Pseudocohnilembus persalinus]|eukprot:KRX06450.1 Protein kinase-like domain [Pseudocohnilembus persalinus]